MKSKLKRLFSTTLIVFTMIFSINFSLNLFKNYNNTTYASSNTITANSLSDNQDVVLTEDTILNVDVDKTIKSISGEYTLTINGSKTLTIKSDDCAIKVSSLCSNAKLVVNSSSDEKFCIYADGNIEINNDLTITSHYGLSSAYGDIILDGNMNITTSGADCIVAQNGSVLIKSETSSLIASKEHDSKYRACIWALKDVTIQNGNY
ncbi:MAG: hypothetical protein IJX17_02570, partial [Clostridia bacterium]|nr:hypothetical protein [Clostridia bacterium]